jgi:hypothetical protein
VVGVEEHIIGDMNLKEEATSKLADRWHLSFAELHPIQLVEKRHHSSIIYFPDRVGNLAISGFMHLHEEFWPKCQIWTRSIVICLRISPRDNELLIDSSHSEVELLTLDVPEPSDHE